MFEFLTRKFYTKNIITQINKSHKIKKYIWFITGLLLMAIAFNIFILPLNLVSGVSGIGVILNETIGLDPSLVILLANILLIIASFTFLGKDETVAGIAGAILYPVFVELTSFLPIYVDLADLESIVITVSGAVISGIGAGMVFKVGYNSGGSDVIKKIVSKYAKLSIGTSSLYVEAVIISLCLITFGWQTFIYSIVALAISSYLTDKVIIGISDHKTFQIITSKEKEVMNFIMYELKRGVTSLEAHGGYTGNKKKVLLCTVPSRQYYMVKEGIKIIDPDAFYIVTDAYEVSGGE